MYDSLLWGLDVLDNESFLIPSETGLHNLLKASTCV
jgi:hypothetical protein